MLPSSPWIWEREGNRRGGGKVGIAGGDFQGAGENLGLVFHGSVFSTAHHVGPVAYRNPAIQMLMDGHSLACERVTPTRLVELPPLIANGDGVVVGHHAFGL